MRVVFIQTYDTTQPYQDSMPPLGIGYLSSYAKEKCWFLETFFCKTAEEALKIKPDLIGISSATENFNDAIAIAKKIKKNSNIPIILGGIHITSLPHTLPECFDIAVIGEGEETFTEIIKAYNENTPSIEELQKIKGLCFHHNEKVLLNPPRDFIKQLDVIPYPDRKILGESWLIPTNKQVHMITSRGCPYDCIFCASSLHWQKFRTFSAKYVVDEIEKLIEKYHPQEIYFFDDLFIGHIPRFKEICKLMKERRLNKNTIFRSYARVDLVNEELADLFVEINFKYIDFGFESNSEKILKYYNKVHATPQVNQRAIDILSERNISIGGNFLVGAEIESPDDMKTSLDFCIKNKDKLDRLSVGPVQPLPGTQLWFRALQDKIVSEDMDWSRFRYNPDENNIDRMPYICKETPKHELEKILNDFNTLAQEINRIGESRKLHFDLNRKENELNTLKSELMTIKGSRIVKAALKIRDFFNK